MKKIIYGNTGYGKSYTYIAPIIKEKNNLILITSNDLKSELEFMGLNKDIIDIGSVNDKTKEFGKIAITFEGVPECLHSEALVNMLNMLENNNTTNDEKVTIILIGFMKEMNDRHFVERIENWKANVVVEYCCMKDDVQRGELDYILEKSCKWDKISVFESCKNEPLIN